MSYSKCTSRADIMHQMLPHIKVYLVLLYTLLENNAFKTPGLCNIRQRDGIIPKHQEQPLHNNAKVCSCGIELYHSIHYSQLMTANILEGQPEVCILLSE